MNTSYTLASNLHNPIPTPPELDKTGGQSASIVDTLNSASLNNNNNNNNNKLSSPTSLTELAPDSDQSSSNTTASSLSYPNTSSHQLQQQVYNMNDQLNNRQQYNNITSQATTPATINQQECQQLQQQQQQQQLRYHKKPEVNETMLILQQLIQRRTQLKDMDRQLFQLISECLSRLEQTSSSTMPTDYSSQQQQHQSQQLWHHQFSLMMQSSFPQMMSYEYENVSENPLNQNSMQLPYATSRAIHQPDIMDLSLGPASRHRYSGSFDAESISSSEVKTASSIYTVNPYLAGGAIGHQVWPMSSNERHSHAYLAATPSQLASEDTNLSSAHSSSASLHSSSLEDPPTANVVVAAAAQSAAEMKLINLRKSRLLAGLNHETSNELQVEPKPRQVLPVSWPVTNNKEQGVDSSSSSSALHYKSIKKRFALRNEEICSMPNGKLRDDEEMNNQQFESNRSHTSGQKRARSVIDDYTSSISINNESCNISSPDVIKKTNLTTTATTFEPKNSFCGTRSKPDLKQVQMNATSSRSSSMMMTSMMMIDDHDDQDYEQAQVTNENNNNNIIINDNNLLDHHHHNSHHHQHHHHNSNHHQLANDHTSSLLSSSATNFAQNYQNLILQSGLTMIKPRLDLTEPSSASTYGTSASYLRRANSIPIPGGPIPDELLTEFLLNTPAAKLLTSGGPGLSRRQTESNQSTLTVHNREVPPTSEQQISQQQQQQHRKATSGMELPDAGTTSGLEHHQYNLLSKFSNREHKKLIAHQCHVCGSGFEDRHRLQQHLSIHLNLHPSWFEERTIKETMAQYEAKRGNYLCQECSISFETTGEFDKHMQLHGEKPHKCDLCFKESKNVSFRFYRQLLTHLRSHCFLYCCRFVPNCKQKANRKDYLKLHILKHHLNNKLPECYTICCH